MLVDEQGAAVAQREPGGRGERGLRADPGGEQDQVGGDLDPSDRLAVTVPLPASRSAVTDVPSRTSTPAGSSSSMLRAISGSRAGMTCPASSTSVTARPRCRSASADSRPMNPAPMITARRAPPSTSSRSTSTSGTVRSTRTAGRPAPGIGGMTGAAPVDSTSTS